MPGANLYTAYVDIEARGAGQTAASLKAVDAAAGSAEGRMKSLGGSMRSIGGSMMRVGGILTATVTPAVTAAGVGMVKLASDAAETGQKFDVVFGKQAPKMNKWITDLMKTMPSTRQELQAMTSTMQDFLVPMGVAPGKAKAMTRELTVLIGDLASFNNLPIAEDRKSVV